jgi:hypothetical protein
VKKWKKSSADAIARFDKLVAVPGAERAVLFGCPVYKLDGERYATLYEERIVLRLPEADIAALLKKGGERFEPIKGRASKERVVLPELPSAALKKLIAKAVKHARAA